MPCSDLTHSTLPSQPSVNGINGSEITDDVIICDVTDEDAEVTEETSRVLDQG